MQYFSKKFHHKIDKYVASGMQFDRKQNNKKL